MSTIRNLMMAILIIAPVMAILLTMMPREETSAASDYAHRRLITIDHTKVGLDNNGTLPSTGFPVLISLSGNWLKTTTADPVNGRIESASGYDIIFTKSDGETELYHEIERYDGTTGALAAWVRLDSLSKSSDTSLYIYYGNPSVTSPTEDPANVWDSGHAGVWHLHDDLLDSTANNNDGTDNGSSNATGKMGDGQAFDGTNDYIGVSNSTSLGITANITLESWFNPDQTLSGNADYFQSLIDSGSYSLFFDKTDGKIKFVLNSATAETWGSVGSTALSSTVWALVTYNGALYVGGAFTDAGGDANADYIAMWNGSAWSSVGGTALSSTVRALGVYNGALYVGGAFTNAGGDANADYIALWNGSAWSSVGSTALSGNVYALGVYDGALYVGGNFTNVGGDANADYIALWNGTAWSSVGGTALSSSVWALAVYNGALYVGGLFTNAGGDANADYITLWNGSAWSSVGSIALSSIVYALAVYNGALYVGGAFTNVGGDANADYIALWNGTSWSSVGGVGLSSSVRALAVYNGALYVGGAFTNVGGDANADYIALWNGSAWSSVGGTGLSQAVYALAVYTGALYIGGQFQNAGGDNNADRIARFSSGDDVELGTATTNWQAGTWHHIVATYDGSSARIYVDGALEASTSATIILENLSLSVFLGKSYGSRGAGTNEEIFDGTIDETRISSAARDADWVRTTYNNQNVPGDVGSPGFYRVGSEVAAPTVSSTSPNFAAQGATNMDIVITGSNFTGASAISFGSGITVNSYVVNSATQMTANITVASDATPGTRDISVSVDSLTTFTLSSGFAVTSPSTVTYISPTFATHGATVDVTVTGTNFTGVAAVSFGSDITVNSYTVNSDTQITANITVGDYVSTGVRDVSVTAGGSTGTLSGGFMVIGIPTVTGASPAVGAQGATIDIVIAGSDLTGAYDVSLGTGITVTGFVVQSSTHITATVTIDSSAATGAREIAVTTAGGTGTCADAFTVISPPTVTAISINGDTEPGATVEVIITGTDFTWATEINMGEGITVESFTVDSPTQITVRITIASDAAEGPRDVSVTAGGQTTILPDALNVESPDDNPPLPFNQPWLFLLALALMMLIAGVIIYRRRRNAPEPIPVSATVSGDMTNTPVPTDAPLLPSDGGWDTFMTALGFETEELKEPIPVSATVSGDMTNTPVPTDAPLLPSDGGWDTFMISLGFEAEELKEASPSPAVVNGDVTNTPVPTDAPLLPSDEAWDTFMISLGFETEELKEASPSPAVVNGDVTNTPVPTDAPLLLSDEAWDTFMISLGFETEELKEASPSPAVVSSDVTNTPLPTVSPLLPSDGGQEPAKPVSGSEIEGPKEETVNHTGKPESLGSKGLRQLLLGED